MDDLSYIFFPFYLLAKYDYWHGFRAVLVFDIGRGA